MNSYAKFGGAARRRFSAICEKPLGGGHLCAPPGRARVKDLAVFRVTECGAEIRVFLRVRGL